jgi:lipopolysaccharide biosynthesis regulator YciM
VAEEKGVKKISAKAIMADLRAGSSDAELMKKYNLSYSALQDIFSKLVEANLATQAYFNKRALKQSPVLSSENSTRTCPHCGYSTATPFTKCPRCEQEVSDWLNTVELTNILTGSFH